MKRIQIELTGKGLDEVLDEMATDTSRAIVRAVSANGQGELVQRIVRQTARRVLGKYVHAYDVCGLASVCHEGNEVDPWGMKDQDED